MKANKSVWLSGIAVVGFVLSVMLTGCPSEAPPGPGPSPPGGEGPVDEPVTETPDEGPVDEPVMETPDEGPVDEPVTETPDEGAPEGAAAQAKAPLGLPPVPVPDDNPMTEAKIELGRALYFDKRLSKDGTIACATCHDPTMAWTEHKATSTGIGGQVGGANSPTVINAAYAPVQFWDGRAASLEEQALGPIENPIEMGHKLDAMIPELNEIAGYKERFQDVFGTDVTRDGIAKAIAAFERTVLSGNSPYDKFKAGDESALSDAQKRGLELFDDAGCSMCHAPPVFSQYKYFNAGVGMDKDPPDAGRKAVTDDDKDLGKFRVPALREVANTGPYFHDGSCDTLEKAVAMMAGGGMDNPNLSPMIKAVGSKELSAEDQAAIVEFLKALSGEFPVVDPPELP